MKKGLLVLIIVGASLLTVGGTMFAIAAARGSFNNNDYTKEVTNEFEFEDAFNNIDIEIVTADLTFKPAADNKTKVVSIEREKIHHTAEVNDGTLIIKENDEREFYEKWFGNLGKMEVTVYLPETTYDNLKINVVTGDTSIQDSFYFANQEIHATTGDVTMNHVGGINSNIKVTTGKINIIDYHLTGSFSLETTTGDIKLEDMSCKSAEIHTTTGDIMLKSFLVENKLTISGTNTDVNFVNCDASTLDIKTVTGHVKGNLLTPKEFKAKTTTGDIKVYSTQGAPECKVETTTGDIEITIGAE